MQLHTAVFLFGLAGLFGKFVSTNPFWIVFGRTAFATLVLLLLFAWRGQLPRPKSWRDAALLLFTGLILAVHWVAFFHSIQISTVAIGLLTFSTFPLFVTFMEPYFFKEPLQTRDVATAVLVFIGLLLIVPTVDLSNNLTQGALWGTFSGFTFAILSLLNRHVVQTYSPQAIALFQDGTAALVLFPFAYFSAVFPTQQDWLLLLILGIFCTALAHAAFIGSLRTIKAQVASVVAGLEPLYGIITAVFLIPEPLTPKIIIGGLLILSATLLTFLTPSHP